MGRHAVTASVTAAGGWTTCGNAEWDGCDGYAKPRHTRPLSALGAVDRWLSRLREASATICGSVGLFGGILGFLHCGDGLGDEPGFPGLTVLGQFLDDLSGRCRDRFLASGDLHDQVP